MFIAVYKKPKMARHEFLLLVKADILKFGWDTVTGLVEYLETELHITPPPDLVPGSVQGWLIDVILELVDEVYDDTEYIDTLSLGEQDWRAWWAGPYAEDGSSVPTPVATLLLLDQYFFETGNRTARYDTPQEVLFRYTNPEGLDQEGVIDLLLQFIVGIDLLDELGEFLASTSKIEAEATEEGQ
jgi:hypothetical protein